MTRGAGENRTQSTGHGGERSAPGQEREFGLALSIIGTISVCRMEVFMEPRNGYAGYFADPGGSLWGVAWIPGFPYV